MVLRELSPSSSAGAIRCLAASFLLWAEPSQAFQSVFVAQPSSRAGEHALSTQPLRAHQQRERFSFVAVPQTRFPPSPVSSRSTLIHQSSVTGLWATKQEEATDASTTKARTTNSFIDTELRGAAMRLHTKSQAPREGQAPEPTNQQPHTTTLKEYLQFLVDSQLVFQALEDAVNGLDELSMFRNTGLERTAALEQDIAWICQQYQLDRPAVAEPGRTYATLLSEMQSVPEFVCHWYNHYFAHTAGGRMIGKQMSALLLDNKTLEFYKWEGDLNELKSKTKQVIEDLAAAWTPEERKECVDATAAAFQGGGSLVSHLSGGQSSPH